jgi:molybdate transport system permease protein
VTGEEIEVLALSLKTSLVALVLLAPVAVPVGWLLARRKGGPARLLEALVTLPLVLPPVVTGYLLLLLFSHRGPLGGALAAVGVEFVLNWKGAALAAAVAAFPFMVLAVRVGIEGVEPGLEDAARTLGAGRLRVFFTVTLPLARGGVVAGALVAFARAFGEFGATLMVAGNIPGSTRTVPLAIYSHILSGRDERAFRLVLVAVAVALVTAWLGGILLHRERRRREAEAGA